MSEERVRVLVVGAGASGLACADHLARAHGLAADDYLVCDADSEVGGYCKTIAKDGFTWDYSGHFFHFRHPEIETYLVDRMGGQKVLEVVKRSSIYWKGGYVDFPFQKNIHQLPRADFIDALYDLYFREEGTPASFEEMLYRKFGRSIAEMFLVPYNEKLYATDLSTLDVDAMGRFFPYADVDDVIRNFKAADNASYNSTFTYPEGGAIQYIHALMRGVDASRVALNERVVSLDLAGKTARTSRGRSVRFDHLVSSAPFPTLLEIAEIAHDPRDFTWNKVLVFNLGFDAKGPRDEHWIYYPQRELSFYRLGFYDNIFGTDRLSMYVELGYPMGATIDEAEIERARLRVLDDLRTCGIVDRQRLVSWHTVTLDPAYVHITKRSVAEVARVKADLAQHGVHSIGRYGSWTYCSIEDNIVEARALADRIAAG
ncbi:MAG: NAD(P)/FAD-dependent oxidoreductase [Sandaracinaceae bacterium]